MTAGLLSFLGVGFLLGFRHAFEPDHLAAVTMLAVRDRGWSHAARLGVAWGVGHTGSVAMVVLVLIVLGVHVPASFHEMAELGVAALLILLGGSSLVAELRRRREATVGDDAKNENACAHPRAARLPISHVLAQPAHSAARALGFGVAHGLAGSGAIVVLLVAAASTVQGQLGYLAAFGVGTIAGMSIVSLVAGVATAVAGARSVRVAQHLRVGAAVATSLVGVLLGWTTYQG